MGTCYSKTGHDASFADKDKLPRDKKKRSSKNGHAGSLQKPRLIIEDCDSIQKDVSDTVYTEDSHFIQGTDIDNCINKSQQTSLEKLVKDVTKAAENDDVDTEDDLQNSEGFDVVEGLSSSDGLGNEHNVDLMDQEAYLHEKLAHLDTSEREGKVSTSDSGIVIEPCRGCDKLEQNCDKKDENCEDFDTCVGSVDGKSIPEAVEEKITNLANKSACNCSKQSGDSNNLVNQTDYSSKGECQGHFISRSFVNTSSESLLKSSLKKGSSNLRRKKRLSWKSADSLDLSDSMTVGLDRTKSVCSSILGDDISLLTAPLATFDSIDFALGNSCDFSKCVGENMKNQLEYRSDTFQFQFDFSGLEGNNRRSVSSVDRLSECTNRTTESTTDLDKIRLAIRHLSIDNPTEHR